MCAYFIDIKNVKIRDLAKLRDSNRLLDIMRQIDIFQSRQKKAEDVLGPVESDPEYLLIVEANNLIVEIDDEICMILFLNMWINYKTYLGINFFFFSNYT